MEALTATRLRLVARMAIRAASAAALAPSYMEALAQSRPVSLAIMVWYSKMHWSVPWLTSAW